MTKINKEGWEIKSFEKIVMKLPKAKQVKTDAYDSGSKYPIISQEETYISGYCDDESMLFHIERPVVIFGDHTRVLKYVDFDFVVGADGVKIIMPTEELNAKLLYYYLKWYNVPSLGYSRHYKLLKELNIPLPPLPIQRLIVDELDEINAIISAKKEQISKLDELAQSIFYNMFGDPVANEKGWEAKKLGEETTEIKYGTSSPACPNGQYKYLRMCNISYDGHLDFSDLKYIDVPDSEIEKCIVRYGDILFNRTNSLELIGKTCMFDVEEPMVIAGYIIRVRLTEKLHPRYVSVAFNLPSMKKLLRNMAKGAVNQANINSKELASINIPLPPLPLQEAFAARVAAIEEEKSSIAASIEKLQTLLDARMQEYFG